MTVYALSTAVLAPLTLVLTGSWPRRRALCFGLALFAAGNALCALAPTFPVLLLGRVLMGIGAIFTPISAGIAVAMVEPAQRGRALALVFLGISLSYVIGVPLGAWLGFRFGWQWPIALVAAAALASSLALWRLLPRHIAAPGASFKSLPGLLAQATVQSPASSALPASPGSACRSCWPASRRCGSTHESQGFSKQRDAPHPLECATSPDTSHLRCRHS